MVDATDEGAIQASAQDADVHVMGQVAACTFVTDVGEHRRVRQRPVDVNTRGILRGTRTLPGADDMTPVLHARLRGDFRACGASRRLVPGVVAAGHDVVVFVFGIAVNADEPLVVAFVHDGMAGGGVGDDCVGINPGGNRVVAFGREVQLAGSAARNGEVV